MTTNDIRENSFDIIVMLKQSFKKSFPTENFKDSYFLNKVENLIQYLEGKKAIIYGCFKNQILVGFIWFFEQRIVNQSSIHINHFVVHEDHRRLGIGGMLWSEVENYALQKGINEIKLMVTKTNEGAVKFYQNADFEIERFIMKKRL